MHFPNLPAFPDTTDRIRRSRRIAVAEEAILAQPDGTKIIHVLFVGGDELGLLTRFELSESLDFDAFRFVCGIPRLEFRDMELVLALFRVFGSDFNGHQDGNCLEECRVVAFFGKAGKIGYHPRPKALRHGVAHRFGRIDDGPAFFEDGCLGLDGYVADVELCDDNRNYEHPT